jgi:hypothetical protein
VSINLSGSGQFTLTNLSLTSAPSLTITDNSIYNLTNNPNSYFGITGGLSFTTLNLAGSHTIDITSLVLDVKSFTIIDNSTGATANSIDNISSGSTSLTNLNISGSHSIDIGSDAHPLSPSAGITVNSSNTAGVDLWLTSAVPTTGGSATPVTYTNNITFGSGTNSLTLNSTTTAYNNIANNITVSGNNSNTITLIDNPVTNSTITNTVTLASPNQDINHYTAITDTTLGDLVLTFSNTINSNNSGASIITQVTPTTGSTFQADLNQAIQQASISSPFAYFNIADNLVPGHPDGGSSSSYDTVIVDHSQTNLGTTFVPGQDAFIVLVGVSITGATVASGAIHVAA